jgi:methylenetetrahydrofolate reductase (NADPH)
MSHFRDALASGKKLITLELTPPKGTDLSLMLERAKPLSPWVDAINVPDSQRAMLKMSSMAASKVIQDELGLDTVWQLTGRDRNVLALQGDLMGGWALGLRNVLALTGDPVAIGDQSDVAKQVSHVEALRLLELIRALNDGKDAAGAELKRGGTDFCYGAALNPNKMSRTAQQHRLEYKIRMGVQYFQTQPVYDAQTVKDARILIQELSAKYENATPKLLVGIIPPKSADFARFLNAKLPGVFIPNHIVDLLEKSSDPVQEAIAYSADLVAQFWDDADGFHFMPVSMEKRAPQLLEKCLQPFESRLKKP